MGNDYYATNENLVHADGSLSLSGEIFGYYPITHQYFARYACRSCTPKRTIPNRMR